MRWGSRDWLATLWVGPLALGVHLLGVKPEVMGVWSDDQVYLDMATSLAQGNGLHVGSLPLAPLTAKYPPGWPAFLALGIASGADPTTQAGLFALLSGSAVCWAAAAQVVVTSVVPRIGGGRAAQVIVGLLLAVNTATMETAVNGMSEACFTLLLCVAIALALRSAEAGRRGKAELVVLAGVVALAGLTRSVASPLALGAVGLAAFGRKPATAAAICAGWLLQAGVVHHLRASTPTLTGDAARVLHYYTSYDEHVAYYADSIRSGEWRAAAERLAGVALFNGRLCLRTLGTLIWPSDLLGTDPGGSGLATTIAGGAAAALAAVAAVFDRRARAAATLCGLYAGIFVLWTWPFSHRFWLPVFPTVVALAVVGLAALGNVGRLLQWPLAVLLVAVNSLTPGYRLAGWLRADEGARPRSAEAALAERLSALIKPDDVLLGALYVASIGRRIPSRSMELEALLPSEDRLGLMLGRVDLRADAGRLAAEIGTSLEALQRILPAGSRAWVFTIPSMASAGQARMAPLIQELTRAGRLKLVLDEPDARVYLVDPAGADRTERQP